VNKLARKYRKGAVWVMHSDTLAAVQSLVDGNGRPIFIDPINGEPGKLLGYPVFDSEYVDGLGAGKKAIAFGNFNAGYVVADRTKSLAVKRLEKDYGVDAAASKRTDGRVYNPSAFVIVACHA
jgi:HK97 family phage major capsid protein